MAQRALPPDRGQALHDLDRFLSLYEIVIAPVTQDHARIAFNARIRFAGGFGAAAGRNFEDGFAYAPAKSENAKLLHVGNDFGMTDVESALQAQL